MIRLLTIGVLLLLASNNAAAIEVPEIQVCEAYKTDSARVGCFKELMKESNCKHLTSKDQLGCYKAAALAAATRQQRDEVKEKTELKLPSLPSTTAVPIKLTLYGSATNHTLEISNSCLLKAITADGVEYLHLSEVTYENSNQGNGNALLLCKNNKKCVVNIYSYVNESGSKHTLTEERRRKSSVSIKETFRPSISKEISSKLLPALEYCQKISPQADWTIIYDNAH